MSSNLSVAMDILSATPTAAVESDLQELNANPLVDDDGAEGDDDDGVGGADDYDSVEEGEVHDLIITRAHPVVSEYRPIDDVISQLMDDCTEGQPGFLFTFDVAVPSELRMLLELLDKVFDQRDGAILDVVSSIRVSPSDPRDDVLAESISGLSGTSVSMTRLTLTLCGCGRVTVLEKWWNGRLASVETTTKKWYGRLVSVRIAAKSVGDPSAASTDISAELGTATNGIADPSPSTDSIRWEHIDLLDRLAVLAYGNPLRRGPTTTCNECGR